jgi:hypothetical protein
MLKSAANVAVLALASALLTPVVLGAVGTAPPTMEAVAATPAPPAHDAAAAPACVRKVKVVYAGYGANTGCAPTEAVR